MSQDAVVFVRKAQEVWVSCSGNLFFTLIWLKFDLMTRRSSKESDYPTPMTSCWYLAQGSLLEDD